MKQNRYKFHRIIGLLAVPFLLLSVLTGFFRANHSWFWKEDYKKVKNKAALHWVHTPPIGIDSLQRIVRAGAGDSVLISEIKLRNEAAMQYYEVRVHGGKPLLVDAVTGQLKSPLSAELAVAFAGKYVKEGTPMKTVSGDETYRTRKEKQLRPVYIVQYDDVLHTSIYIDKYSGEIVEEIDDNLKIGFWMVKLHDYDFFSLKRTNLNLVAFVTGFAGLSGACLWLRRKRVAMRR